MSLRKISSVFFAAAIMVAVAAVSAHAHARMSAEVQSPEDGEFRGAVELARCPYRRPPTRPPARPSARSAGRKGRSATTATRVEKPWIKNVAAEGQARDRHDDVESGGAGGFYGEDGTFHADNAPTHSPDAVQ